MEKPGIGMKLKIVTNAFGASFSQRVAAFGLTSTQAHMLGYIVRREGETVYLKDLETFFNLRHPTVTGIVQRLEEKGFVVCTGDSRDRRRKIVRATEKSRELTQDLREGRQEIEARVTAGVTPGELREFNRVLDIMLQNVGHHGFPPCAVPAPRERQSAGQEETHD